MRAAAALSGCAMSTPYRLTGQSLLRAERNLNECNWSRARKKIGPVNQPCDRPIDVISIASLIFLVTSRLADQRNKPVDLEVRFPSPYRPRLSAAAPPRESNRPPSTPPGPEYFRPLCRGVPDNRKPNDRPTRLCWCPRQSSPGSVRSRVSAMGRGHVDSPSARVSVAPGSVGVLARWQRFA